MLNLLPGTVSGFNHRVWHRANEAAMNVFNSKDFSVFDIAGFEERMHAIRQRIAPRLETIAGQLAPEIAALVDQPVFAHVARHARRTVNAPDDTWVAFGLDKRGYKKDVHFKVAISRKCVRLLFEVGPEYYEKSEWTRSWAREFDALAPALSRGTQLGWFKGEHDEDPACLIRKLDSDQLRALGSEPSRRRDGQLVIGRRLDQSRVIGMNEAAFVKAAVTTFRPLVPLFGLHDQRVLA
jgi:uncharacterized protein YktB (UPF0637 family)